MNYWYFYIVLFGVATMLFGILNQINIIQAIATPVKCERKYVIPYEQSDIVLKADKVDYSLGKGVHYKRRNALSKSLNDKDIKTDIQVDYKENVKNAKAGIVLRKIKKVMRQPQPQLQPAF